ncbi:MAG TPA: HlyD family efflux transporter periplasmic adaptor subunit [Candidatus Paceibacterota bacterium]|nr:HlyD family efflux transporter periplasmic adaptor subunit [Candidatus Paceibacterota bacterium]
MSRLATWWSGLKRFVFAHKIWSGIIAVVVVGGSWWLYGITHPAVTQTYYVMGTVSTGTIVQSVSESGQVSTTNSVDIQPKVSGEITSVVVHAGQHVSAGQTLMTIDNTTALQSYNDAKKQLAADQLSYQQSQAEAPINYQKDQNALATAQENLQDDYNSTYNDLVTSYLDLPDVMNGAQDAIYGYDFDPKKVQWNIDVLSSMFTGQENTTNVNAFKSTSLSDYQTANTAYAAALALYEATPRTATTTAQDKLLSQSIDMETGVAQALQTELNYFGAVSDLAQTYNLALPSKFSTVQSSTRTSLSTENGDLQTLLNDQKSLNNDEQAITSAQQTLTLDQVGNPNGDNPISLQVSANSIAKEQEDLATQQQNLADYTIVAPFSGIISAVNANVGDNANGTLATIISDSQIAQLSVNEVDAAKLQVGNKATLTFDAIPDLTLTGTVAEVNSVGTVSQGVVSYDLKISFDANDPRVKSGMTVNAAIQTAVAQNTLMVPSSAVKSSVSGGSYVLAFDPPIATSTIATAGAQGIISATPPVQVPVTIGISDDTDVQILSGLTEGQQIVASTRTSSGTAVTTTTSAGGAGRVGGGGGGGATFITRGL